MVAGAAGAVLGDSALYWIARRNRGRMERQLTAAMANEKVATAMEVIGSSAASLLVFGRYVPGLRFVVNATLGLAGHPYGEFLRWSAVGGVAWSIYICGVAYAVGTALVDNPLAAVIIAGLASSVAVAIVFVVVARRVRRIHRAGGGGRAHRVAPKSVRPEDSRRRCAAPRGGITVHGRVAAGARDSGPYIAVMADIVLGVLAILAGSAMLVAGQFVLRLVIPIWAFFAGFAFGAGIVAAFADEHFLGTVLGWALGLLFAVIFALLAYMFYWLGVVITMGAAGYAIGSGIILAFGFDWDWVAASVGLALGIAFGLVSAFANVPMIVLVVIGSVAGAVGVTGGLMLLVGSLNSSDFTEGDFTNRVSDSFGWALLVLVLAIGGIAVQVRQRAVLRQSIHETWYAESR